jgi:hypothetical protein
MQWKNNHLILIQVYKLHNYNDLMSDLNLKLLILLY